MSRKLAEFVVTWTADESWAGYVRPTEVSAILAHHYPGAWSVLSKVPSDNTHLDTCTSLYSFTQECLRHVPDQFHDDMGAQQTIIRYLASVQDLMSLLKEHVR